MKLISIFLLALTFNLTALAQTKCVGSVFEEGKPESEKIIWPAALTSKLWDDVMEESYFAKYRKK